MVATTSVPRVRFVRVRRSGNGRSFVVLDAETRDRYADLVARSADAIEALLSPAVMANRVASWELDPPELRLRPWRVERRRFAARLADLAAGPGAIAFADVHRCYSSISPAMVGRALRRAGLGTAREIEGLLRALERVGVRGLPVGPDASAVLANAVLAQVDRTLAGEGIEYLRWVDDIVVTAADPWAALSAIRRAVERIGLRLNEGKTRIVLDPASLRGRAPVSGC
jgi:hypothetical protein